MYQVLNLVKVKMWLVEWKMNDLTNSMRYLFSTLSLRMSPVFVAFMRVYRWFPFGWQNMVLLPFFSSMPGTQWQICSWQHLDIDLWPMTMTYEQCEMFIESHFELLSLNWVSASRHSMKISIMNSHSKIQECNLSSHGEPRYKSSNRRFAVSASATSVQRLQISTIRTNNPESPWWRLSPLI